MPGLTPEVQGESSVGLDIATCLLYFLFLALIAVASLLIVNVTLSWLSVLTVSALWILITVAIFHREIRRINPWCLLISIILIALAILACYLVYDTSFDGQVYHRYALLSLKSGWNPFWHVSYPDSIFVEHYAKGPWLASTYIYSLLNKVETGKAINMLAMLASLLLTDHLLIAYFKRIPRFLALVLAVLVAFNPVTAGQVFTYYDDGLLASFLTVYFICLVGLCVEFNRRYLFLAAFSLMFLVNIKFTAIAYAGVISTCFLLILIAQKSWEELKKSFFWLLLAGLVGLLIVGYNPYVTNTVYNGNPFYPLAGKGQMDVITVHKPSDFVGCNRFVAFTKSIISKTENISSGSVSRRKQMYQVSAAEFGLMTADTRVAGFGPFFYSILFTSLLLFLALWLANRRIAAMTTVVLAGMMASVFVNPECWWARYVPQLWLIPLIVIVAALCTGKKAMHMAGLAIVLLIAMNAGGASYHLIKSQIKQSILVADQLKTLQNKQLVITKSGFISVPNRLQEHHISYTVTSKKGPEQYYFTTVTNPAPAGFYFSDISFRISE